MSSEFAHENIIIVYQEDSNEMDVVDVITIQPNILPCRLSLNSFIRSPATCGSYVRLAPTGSTYWQNHTQKRLLLAFFIQLRAVTWAERKTDQWKSVSTRSLPPEALSSIVREEKRSRSNRLLVGSEDYATVAVAQPGQILKSRRSVFIRFRGKSETKPYNQIWK